jgi:hypothetical protein
MLEVADLGALKRLAAANVAAVPCIAVEREAPRDACVRWSAMSPVTRWGARTSRRRPGVALFRDVMSG